MFGNTRSNKRILVFVPLVFLVLALNAAAAPADARYSSCGSDPIVYLSDGTVLTVYVDIGTDVANVKEVSYTIYAPKNVTPLSVVHTPFPGFLGKEKFKFHDNAMPGQYQTEVSVKTTVKNVSIVATSSFGARTVVVNGLDGKKLTASGTTVVAP
jgi:hypothetical protein